MCQGVQLAGQLSPPLCLDQNGNTPFSSLLVEEDIIRIRISIREETRERQGNGRIWGNSKGDDREKIEERGTGYFQLFSL